jgi:osmotically-inducible protein OsmY
MRRRQLDLLTLSLVATQLLCGCAAYDAYRKCGRAGCSGDAQISTEIRTLLEAHPELGPPNAIYVNTLDRVVYLRGQVATELQRETADGLARRAAGVRNVVDIIGLEYNGL